MFKDYYSEMNILANECRMELGIGKYDPFDIFQLVLDKFDNLTIVFTELGENVRGICSNEFNQKVIFINSADSYGKQRLTLAHEIYHLKYDTEIFNFSIDDDINELKADIFAFLFLMPIDALFKYKEEHNIQKWDFKNIIQLEQYFQINHSTLLTQLKNLNEISDEEYDTFKEYSFDFVKMFGFNTKLYEKFSFGEFYTMGNYIYLTEDLFNKKLMSNGKRDELLLNAYRSDLVFKFENLEDSFFD